MANDIYAASAVGRAHTHVLTTIECVYGRVSPDVSEALRKAAVQLAHAAFLASHDAELIAAQDRGGKP